MIQKLGEALLVNTHLCRNIFRFQTAVFQKFSCIIRHITLLKHILAPFPKNKKQTTELRYNPQSNDLLAVSVFSPTKNAARQQIINLPAATAIQGYSSD